MDALKDALKKALMEIAQEQEAAEQGAKSAEDGSGADDMTDAKTQETEDSDEMAPSLKGPDASVSTPMNSKSPLPPQMHEGGNMDALKALADTGSGNPGLGIRGKAAANAKSRIAAMAKSKGKIS